MTVVSAVTFLGAAGVQSDWHVLQGDASLHADRHSADGPTEEPQEFAPGVVSTNAVEYGPALSPSGDTIYFVRRPSFDEPPAIYSSIRRDGAWSAPTRMAFTSEAGDEYPSVSPDGQRLYFASARPHPEGDLGGQNSLWVVLRGDRGWGEPSPLAIPGAGSSPMSHPVEAVDGSLYFHGRLPDGVGRVDAYRAAAGPDRSFRGVMPLPFNSEAIDGEVAVAPDATWLVFYSDRSGGLGRGDLYAAFPAQGSWGEPVNLGPPVNTTQWEWTPSFSHDGSTLLFARLNEGFDRSDIFVISAAEVRAALGGR